MGVRSSVSAEEQCPRQFNTARKMLVHNLQSVGYRIFFPMISAGLLIAAPPLPKQKRPGSSGQISLVATTSQSVRFARSLARSLLASNQDSLIYIHVFVRSSKRGGGERACTLVAGTQDVP